MITLDRKLIDVCKTERGGFTKAQLSVLGLKWPVDRNQLYVDLVGKKVSEDTYNSFMDAKNIKAKMYRGASKRPHNNPNNYTSSSFRPSSISYSKEEIKKLSHFEDTHIFDTETSGGTNFENRIIQFSSTIMNPRSNVNSYESELRNSMINPECKIKFHASKVHGFKNKDVDNQPLFSEAIDAIMQRTPHGSVLLAHNAECDIRLLYLECLRLDESHLGWLKSLKVIDSVKVSKDLYPEFKKHGLDALIERYKVTLDPKMRHDARGDVLALSECWAIITQDVMNGDLPHSKHMIPIPSMDMINHPKIKYDLLGDERELKCIETSNMSM